MRKFSRQRGPQAFHNSTQQVRAALGLTQDDLAFLLGVSRAAVSMDEHGSRMLPWPQVELLLQLQQAVRVPAAPPPVPDPLPPPLSAADRDALDFRRLGLTLEARPLQQKLARCRVRLAQARRWQQVLPGLRAAFPTAPPHAQQWLDRFERRATTLLDQEAGPSALWQVRLAAISFEIAEIDRLLAREQPFRETEQPRPAPA